MMAEGNALSSHTATAAKKNHTHLEIFPKKGAWTFLETIITISTPFCIWGLTGNGIVWWLLCCRIKKTKFTVYVLNLAVADLIVLFYFSMVFILYLSSLHANIYFLRVMEIMYLLGYNSSIYLLTAVSAVRCLMVFFPVWCQFHLPKHLSETVCAILWSVSCLVSLVVYIVCYPRFLPSLKEGTFSCNVAYTFEIVNLLGVFPIMAFSTLALFITTQKKVPQTPPAGLDVIIMATVALVLIFASSIRITDVIMHWDQKQDGPTLFLLSLLFDSVNSSVKPFVYLCVGCWKRKEAWESTHMILEKALKDEGNRAARTQADQEHA
ncbi:proto-oncogene Mas-like isoform X2 [Hemicordylus capensis]|uniref:proto-oncogene Mas-like isoform X2 n=1 Tax=Hemicordylus capensis TaxID=884348 RepID=UPI002303C4DE|nr:proto-oncogene Mas-like isoform X2 [Hemicordylus capensis]XP_053150679.1 proto-oncogene Mas-like isoform X2 [Hemicordylus capensis]XP_053150688.1 proto-oncogene Mas-like isoform X2 [Hemicordylus capensis]